VFDAGTEKDLYLDQKRLLKYSLKSRIRITKKYFRIRYTANTCWPAGREPAPPGPPSPGRRARVGCPRSPGSSPARSAASSTSSPPVAASPPRARCLQGVEKKKYKLPQKSFFSSCWLSQKWGILISIKLKITVLNSVSGPYWSIRIRFRIQHFRSIRIRIRIQIFSCPKRKKNFSTFFFQSLIALKTFIEEFWAQVKNHHTFSKMVNAPF